MKDPDDLYTLDMFQSELIAESDRSISDIFIKKSKEYQSDDDNTETSATGC